MYFWINFFLWSLGVLWVGIFFALGLEPRWGKVPRSVLAAGFTLICLPVAYLKFAFTATLWIEALYFLGIAILLLYILIPFKDKLWKKILLFILFNAITFISETLCMVLFGSIGFSSEPDFKSPETVLMVSAVTAILLIFSSLLLLVWNRFIMRKATARRVLIFFIFPLSQLITLYAIDRNFTASGSFGGFLGCIGILMGFLADFILLYILMAQGQKEVLAQQLQELETLYRAEYIHYQSIEAKREEMAKLRHDYNNQLVTVYHLAEQGETNQLRALLEAIKADIAGTGEYTYCGNAVVNAVLNEKTAACQDRRIRLETELELSEEVSVQPVHLCSIFTNLLDNAIHAAETCPESERFICVKAARKGDYLHIKVENSAPETKKPNSVRRKGYGQEILRDIAHRYSGEFMTDWKAGVYRAMLSLAMVE